jgi:hypothetical protein
MAMTTSSSINVKAKLYFVDFRSLGITGKSFCSQYVNREQEDWE